jgi:hypothetical protein
VCAADTLSSFSIRSDPQVGQAGVSLLRTSSSKSRWQVGQAYSNKGMERAP